MRSQLSSVLLSLVLCLGFVGGAKGVKTEKLKITMNLTDSGGTTQRSTAWAMDGTWDLTEQPRGLTLQISSKYARSDNAVKFDRLKTWWRFSPKVAKPGMTWQPLLVISTEGDHGFDEAHTLIALGYSKKSRSGFIEFTGGLSKDIRSPEAWMGDIGVLVSYQKRRGKLLWSLEPQGGLDILGDVRYRDSKFRYNIDGNLGYELGGHLSVTYQVTVNNTVANSHHIQFIGITYER